MASYRFSNHALSEMDKRSIDRGLVEGVLASPMQRVHEHGNIECLQSKYNAGGKEYLLRVMVNETGVPPVVVTVYRTSNIRKYWRSE